MNALWGCSPRRGWKTHGSIARWMIANLILLSTASMALAAVEPPAGLQSTPPRLGYIDGEVLFWRPGDGDWEAAQVNTPLAPGDALATRDGKIEMQVGGKSFSVHAEGERMILKRQGEERQEVELVSPEYESATDTQTLPAPVCPDGSPAAQLDEPATSMPGSSPLDAILPQLRASLANAEQREQDHGAEGGAV